MKIFLTGQSGFIGSHLCAHLGSHELEFLRHDLREHDKVSQQVIQSNPDIIIHLAARTEVEQSFNEQISFSEVNYVGTVNLIEAAKSCKNLQRFLFASTMEVYGWQPDGDAIRDGKDPTPVPVFDETTLPCPNAPYAVTKLAVEHYLSYASRAYGTPFTAIRQTNCYGRINNDFFVTERIISQMLQNHQKIDLGDPRPYRNFIFIDDLIEAWCSIVNRTDVGVNEVYCVGPDNALQIQHWAQMIAEKLDWHGTINWHSRPVRPGEVFVLNSSNKKITRDFGWYPKTGLDIGLDLAIHRWKSNNL